MMGAAWLHFPPKVTALPGLSIPSLGPLSTPSRAGRHPGAYFLLSHSCAWLPTHPLDHPSQGISRAHGSAHSLTSQRMKWVRM